jgi:hypothetical protein
MRVIGDGGYMQESTELPSSGPDKRVMNALVGIILRIILQSEQKKERKEIWDTRFTRRRVTKARRL